VSDFHLKAYVCAVLGENEVAKYKIYYLLKKENASPHIPTKNKLQGRFQYLGRVG